MKIHVGNLSSEINEEDLRRTFEKIGKIESLEIMKEKYNDGKTKIFAFVEMESEESGQSAIDSLNGKVLKGSILKVSEALAKKEGSGGKKRFSGGREDRSGSKGMSIIGKSSFGGARAGSVTGKGGKRGFSGGRGGRGR